jgi:hypothetical protein
MMKRRGGGGGVQSSTGSPSSRDATTTNRQYESNPFSNERTRTIIVTSSIWALILAVSLFTAIRFSSPTNCSQSSLVKSN